MKKLLMFLVVGSLLPVLAMAHQTIEESEFLTDILKIEQDHGFPVETIKLTYLTVCSLFMRK
ncbi:MAG: hypothetical protein IPM97_05240 [Bdellovibrionaceae bacterium]|nr:hypothetical protein [Pseudobdellovibrionaceae bacterium]